VPLGVTFLTFRFVLDLMDRLLPLLPASYQPDALIGFHVPGFGVLLALAVLLSAVALCWNYVFNAGFEWWEAHQSVKGRSLARRVVHGAGFEGGLTLILVPVMAWWLDTTFLNAFLANVGLLLYFFVYAIAFTWAFDKVFGLPQSAQPSLPSH
jgi:uncharacterized membrane protein